LMQRSSWSQCWRATTSGCRSVACLKAWLQLL
jgi:hypothetical protein